MYSLIRVLVVLIFLVLFIKLKKKNKPRKFMVTFVGLCILTLVLISSYPIENYLYAFKSPQSAYKYMYSKTELYVLDGDSSTLVVPTEDINNCPREIFPKSNNGWKLPNIKEFWPVIDSFYESASVKIRKCNSDYYVFVSADNVGEISDNKGSKFYCETNQLSENIVHFSAYAYVDDITDYEIMLDGEPIKVC